MADKAIAIIGGGLAGLAAGVYAQRNGYRTHIFEHGSQPGGVAAWWRRGGYHIDGGIHFLMGHKPGGALHELYRQLGTAAPETLIDMAEYGRFVDEACGRERAADGRSRAVCRGAEGPLTGRCGRDRRSDRRRTGVSGRRSLRHRDGRAAGAGGPARHGAPILEHAQGPAVTSPASTAAPPRSLPRTFTIPRCATSSRTSSCPKRHSGFCSWCWVCWRAVTWGCSRPAARVSCGPSSGVTATWAARSPTAQPWRRSSCPAARRWESNWPTARKSPPTRSFRPPTATARSSGCSTGATAMTRSARAIGTGS